MPAASDPVWSEYEGEEKLFVRRNNSTRAVKPGDVQSFIATRFEAE